MKCQLCGNQNPEDAQFCGRCGTSLSTSTPIGVGASSSEPPTGSLPKTIKRNHHRRIKPWMWIVSGVVGLLVILWVGFGLMFTGALGCPEFLGCEDWGQVSRGDSYAELGLYERAIQEYDEAIRLERQKGDAYYKRGLAHEALGKAKEASRDFEMAIQEYDETIRMFPSYAYGYYNRGMAHEALGMTIEAERDFEKAIQEYDEEESHGQFWSAYYQRGVAYEALGKTLEAERDFAMARELGYYSGDSCPVTILDDFTKAIKVTPLVLESEISIEARCQKWSFNGYEGQILRFELRPKSGSHMNFRHVGIHLSLVDDPRITDEISEVIGGDEELREITLPETGTYTIQVDGNPDETSGAYVITISE